MSHKLIKDSPDLKKLEEKGYQIEIKQGHLLMHHVPYVSSSKTIELGILVIPLGDLAGGKTAKPTDHVAYFIGEHPCEKDGNKISAIVHTSGKRTLAEGVEVDHSFSNQPTDGYRDYYEYSTTYEQIISAPAKSVDPSVKSQTYNQVITTEEDPDIPFHYLDTNSTRAEISAISAKLKNLKIAIIGLGGTGSYVLDFVAKTPVKEIHIFDNDEFLSHNAFRSPGAATKEELEQQQKKYLT